MSKIYTGTCTQMKRLLQHLLPIAFLVFQSSCSYNHKPIGPFSISSDDVILAMYGHYGYVFNRFWNIIDTSYIYLNQTDINWREVKKEYLPLMKNISTDSEFGEKMVEVLSMFNDPLLYMSIDKWYYSSKTQQDSEYSQVYVRDLEFDTYKVLGSSCKVLDGGYCFVNTLYSKQYGNESDIYKLICLGEIGENTKTDTNQMHDFFADIMSESPKGIIIDLRKSVFGVYNFSQNEFAFLSNFYPIGNFTYSINYKNYTTNIIVDGINTIPSNIPIVIIVNNNTSGILNILAYGFASLPNVTVVGRNPTNGHGAWSKRKVVGSTGTSSCVLYYPIADFNNWEYDSFYAPLQPDIMVTGEDLHTLNSYDKSLEVTIEVINSLSKTQIGRNALYLCFCQAVKLT